MINRTSAANAGALVRALREFNAKAVIGKLNPIIRGWAAYYRTVVSSLAFAKLDGHVWTLT
ncbi:group II intron maturase-specific domain-containing protein, partial [Streptomyces sp. IB201691-2A2]|uniref:group II intron maturase-specific domain-containing protein n=1 Tax=Streptomyces sp. IB201691-2A2 TaxID=2561920 RepID=UPI00118F0704